jgi:hypothetical protein
MPFKIVGRDMLVSRASRPTVNRSPVAKTKQFHYGSEVQGGFWLSTQGEDCD